MSRFVPGGTVDQPTERSDEWLKAQQAIEATKAKKLPPGQQEGGKSLYETLQANKAAKQDAFEESIRLKNQFRALDADEVDFLDSLNESTRAAESAVRRDTEERLAAFRKARESEERKARAGAGEGEAAPVVVEAGAWAASAKKRKRERAGAQLMGVKARRVSSGAERVEGKGEVGGSEKGEQEAQSVSPPPVQRKSSESPVAAASGSLGLAGYSSSDEE